MGVIAGILFFFCLFFFGLAAVVAGIVGLILFGKKRKKPFIILSAVALALGVAVSSVPVGFFSFIIEVNMTPPEDFVETEIVIEENGYQSERFTADGVVYEVLEDFSLNLEEEPEAIFSYKEEGIMNRSQWGNYYRWENEPGFHLVCDGTWGGSVFCPVEEREQVLAYYMDERNWYWQCTIWPSDDTKDAEEISITGDAAQIINVLHKKVATPEEEQHLYVSYEEDAQCLEFSAYNREGDLFLASEELLYYQEALYIVFHSLPYTGGTSYTVIEVPVADANVLLQAIGMK